MASDPLSYYGIWYWPEDKDGPTCLTAVSSGYHYSCDGKVFLKYDYKQNPKDLIDTEVEFFISPRALVEWSEE
jgi:hypothetical protein